MAALARGASRGGSRLTRGGWAGVCEVCCQCHWRWVSVGACAVRGPLGAHEHVVAVRRGPGHAVRCGEHQGCGGRGSFDVSRRARRCAWRRCAASCLFRGARGGGCRSPLPSLSRPCYPFVDINLYFLCATCVPGTPARSSLDRAMLASCAACAATRGPPGPRSAGSDCRLGFARVAGVPAVRGRGRARFDSRRVRALSRPGYARGQVTKARTTISSYRNIDASAAGSGEPRVRRAYHDDDLVAREVGSRDRVRTGLRPLPRTSERARRGEAG